MSDKTSYGLDTRVKIMTWNLWWRFGPWQDRQAAILETLREEDADIICVQEIWHADGKTLAGELAEALGYHHVYAEGMVMNDVGFGNAILSRWPIGDSASIDLYGREQIGEGRGAVYANVTGPRGDIPVFCTHLSHRYEHSHIRQIQTRELAEFVNSKRPWNFPPVLCGDFNAEPVSEEIRMLRGLTTCPVPDLCFVDAWNVSGDQSPGFTWSNENPYAVEEFEANRRIDYIFVGHPKYRGAGHVTECRLVGDQPVAGVMPSDHFALAAKLRY